MEDIKTNFNKIMAQFMDQNDSGPKKLNFGILNDSLDETLTLPKKRRYSPGLDDSPNGEANSTTMVPPPSPWESKRMRADVIEANSRVSKLKQEMERQHKIHMEKEQMLESRVTELQKQCDYSASKVEDLEKHLQVVRKREHAYKQEWHKTQKEIEQLKTNFEEQLHKANRSRQDVESEARVNELSLTNELSEYRMHCEKLEMDLDLLSDELENTKQQLEKFRDKATAHDEIKLLHEKQEKELESANYRIQKLESEIANYTDWKEIVQNSNTRLMSIQEKNKEIEHLTATNKRLNELVGNKLLLEEQVHDLKTRLEREEGGRSEAVALQVKLSHTEDELKDWVRVAQDHCLPNMLVSPFALRARIEQLLQNDIIQASEKINKIENKGLEFEIKEYKEKCDRNAKDIEALNRDLDRHKKFKVHIQRKLGLISSERDLYKQLLDNMEKDLTMNPSTTIEPNSTEIQLRNRVDVLEKTLMGYKEFCETLERDNRNNLQMTSGRTVDNFDSVMNSKAYEHIRKEMGTLRQDNERLRRRKEELELELEHRCLSGDFNLEKYKVVVFKDSPSSQAYKDSENLVERLQAEIERLKRRNQTLVTESEQTQTQVEQLVMNIKEMSQLRAELETANSKIVKMKEAYKKSNTEFRDVCYMLLGYRIDRVGSSANYKLSSMFAESPEEYLNFRLNEQNVVDMLETSYSQSETLKPLIESHLITHKSLPVFLSALTLELFERATVTLS